MIFFYQVCPKKEFLFKNEKIALVRASIVVTYCIKLFCTRPDRHNDILTSLVLLVAETKIKHFSDLAETLLCFPTAFSFVWGANIGKWPNKSVWIILLLNWVTTFFFWKRNNQNNFHLLLSLDLIVCKLQLEWCFMPFIQRHNYWCKNICEHINKEIYEQRYRVLLLCNDSLSGVRRYSFSKDKRNIYQNYHQSMLKKSK